MKKEVLPLFEIAPLAEVAEGTGSQRGRTIRRDLRDERPPSSIFRRGQTACTAYPARR